MKGSNLVKIKEGLYLPKEVEDKSQFITSKRCYEEKVESLIRERYSVSDELALLRQREEKKEEFNDYYEYVEDCKIRAKY